MSFPTALPTEGIARSEAMGRGSEVDGLTELISPRFFTTVGATLLSGRDFTRADRGNSPAVVIINEALERKLFPNGDALGRRIRIGADPARQAVEVVGVVTDVTVGKLRSPHLPVAFRPRMQEPERMRVPIVTLRVSGDTSAVAAALGPTVRALGQEYVRAGHVLTLDEQLNITLLQERLLAGVSSFFGGLAALLAFVGVYALLAHAVVGRTREIGIRMALGASRGSVMAMVTREGLKLTLLGIVLGVPCAAGRRTPHGRAPLRRGSLRSVDSFHCRSPIRHRCHGRGNAAGPARFEHRADGGTALRVEADTPSESQLLGDAGPDTKLGRLTEKLHWVLEHDPVNELFRVAAASHLHDEPRHRNGIARTPVARPRHANPLGAECFDDVGCTLR
ncbi:MAG: FtsX-like permease family protein [Luteitalea sp.]|nr:FtsX-like permease family protein [Luteitalea sp.]